MEIRLLGPLEVRDGDGVIALPRRQQRALLAALALRAGEVVSTDRLVADLWGDSAPASATGSLQNTVSALRKLIGRDVLLTQTPGYRLAVRRDDVDSNRFERLLRDARGAEPATRARLLGDALELWRGPALADLEEEDFARLEAARLDELRVAAQEERIDAELRLGRHAAVVGELEQLVGLHPLRERLRGQLMVAFYRCGRQAEALEVYRAARLALSDELGLDPSPELQELERRILRQDPELDAPVVAATDRVPGREVSELRLVTVLAATPPAAEDPERHRRLLDETLARVRDTLDRHGGLLERFGPEGLVAVFGADGPADDDAVRAVLAARELGLPAGVATGEVVGGTGAVVTRAAELARVGGIRLDERTAALVRAERRLDAPLVGRREELERLRGTFAAARASARCRVVTVIGEPGIGKTRLARELALREGGAATVLVARCVAHGDGATFLPLLGALHRAEPDEALAGEDDAGLVLTRLAALAEGAQTAPLGESYWAIRRLLEALGRRAPVLLVLDDVHWAEPALVDLIDYLADRASAPLLLLCLARPQLERTLGEELPLGPLSEDEARGVVAGTATLDDETSDRIVGLAEGNALYAEQLASFAAEGGEGLPPTLEAVLAGRLGRLDPAERAVLQRAAVIGREFSLGAVAALVGGEVAHELLALSRGAFVHAAAAADPGDDGYTFHHVLLRDAAYAGLTKADRADLHERAAAWIDRDGPGDDAIAGYHLEQAVRYHRELGEDADELATTAGERLGEAGMRVWRAQDVAAAVGLLGRATALLPTGATQARLLWELAIALRLRGQQPEARSVLEEADRVARTSGARATEACVLAELTEIRLLDGELALDDAVAAFDQALGVIRAEEDDRGLGRAEVVACSVHSLASNLAAVEAAAARAMTHYAAAGFSPAGPTGMLSEALYYGATPADAATSRCISLLEQAPDRGTEANLTAVLGGLRGLVGDAAEARSLLDHARTLYEDTGNTRGVLTVWTPLRVDAEAFAGNLGEATALAEENFRTLAALGEAGYSSTRAVELAELLLRQNADREAEGFVAAAEGDALPSDVLVQFLCRGLRARLLARSGNVEHALDLARSAVTLASLTDVLRYRSRAHLALAEVLSLAGDEPSAEIERAEAESLLRRKGVKGALVRAPST